MIFQVNHTDSNEEVFQSNQSAEQKITLTVRLRHHLVDESSINVIHDNSNQNRGDSVNITLCQATCVARFPYGYGLALD